MNQSQLNTNPQRIQLVKGLDRHTSVYSMFSGMISKNKIGETKVLTDNLRFPNRIRISDWEIEMYLRIIIHKEPVQLSKIFSGEICGDIELHIVDQRVEISEDPQKFLADQKITSRTTEEQLNVLEKHSSWKIDRRHLELYIRAFTVPAVVAIEYRKRPCSPHYNPKFKVHKEELSGVQYNPTIDDFKYRRSFIRNPLSPDEIKEKLIFMDAEFTGDLLDRTRGLVSITILNRKGDILLNEFTTPRHKMICTGEKYHGITENMMRGKKDEYEVIEKVQQLCFGKIIVGHDLNLEIRALNINKKGLLGVRDLSATNTFCEMGLFPKSGGQFFKLQTLAEKILQKSIQAHRNHNSLEDTKAVRDIYKNIEHVFVDHKKWEVTDLGVQKRKSIDDCREIINEKRKKQNLEKEFKILEANLDHLWDPQIELLDEEEVCVAFLEDDNDFTFESKGDTRENIIEQDLFFGKTYIDLATETEEDCQIDMRHSVAVQTQRLSTLDNQTQTTEESVQTIENKSTTNKETQTTGELLPPVQREIEILGTIFRVKKIECESENGEKLSWTL